jgi:hypothetical protein
MPAIYASDASVIQNTQGPGGGRIEAYLFGFGANPIPAGQTLTIEGLFDDEWKTGGVSWAPGEEAQTRSFEIASTKIRAVLSGGTLPSGGEVRIKI